MKTGVERKVIAFLVVTTAGIVLAQAISVLLRKILAPDIAPFACSVLWATLIITFLSLIVSIFRSDRRLQFVSSVTISAITYAGFTLTNIEQVVPLAAILIVCPLIVWGANRLVDYLPESLDGVRQRFPLRSLLWILLAMLMLTQTARLSSWLNDPTQEWWISTTDPEFAPLFNQHMCMVAYIYAADLNRQGEENIYDKSHYPGLNPEAKVHTTVKNLAPDDPYQYPPQFLLLPHLAITLTDDFDLIKIFWLFIQITLFGFIAWSVLRFIGGDRAMMAAFLIPALCISFPFLANLQYGQFHMMTVVLAIVAMVWFSQGKYIIGGSTLAIAMLAKIAPGILLIYLIACKRWKEVGWTLGACAFFSLIAIAVIGTKPFVAFFSYQLPNLQNGSAFEFADIWPDYRDLLIAGNQSPFSFIYKLDALGLPGMTQAVAKVTHLVFSLSVLVVTIIAARIKAGRTQQLLIWLALLNLAAMLSKGAWGDYIPIGTLWAMTFMVKELTSTFRQKLLFAITGVFMFLSLGVLPIPGLGDPALFISLSALGMLIMIGFNFWILFGYKIAPEEAL